MYTRKTEDEKVKGLRDLGGERESGSLRAKFDSCALPSTKSTYTWGLLKFRSGEAVAAVLRGFFRKLSALLLCRVAEQRRTRYIHGQA